jgi:hypothetical protein
MTLRDLINSTINPLTQSPSKEKAKFTTLLGFSEFWSILMPQFSSFVSRQVSEGFQGGSEVVPIHFGSIPAIFADFFILWESPRSLSDTPTFDDVRRPRALNISDESLRQQVSEQRNSEGMIPRHISEEVRPQGFSSSCLASDSFFSNFFSAISSEFLRRDDQSSFVIQPKNCYQLSQVSKLPLYAARLRQPFDLGGPPSLLSLYEAANPTFQEPLITSESDTRRSPEDSSDILTIPYVAVTPTFPKPRITSEYDISPVSRVTVSTFGHAEDPWQTDEITLRACDWVNSACTDRYPDLHSPSRTDVLCLPSLIRVTDVHGDDKIIVTTRVTDVHLGLDTTHVRQTANGEGLLCLVEGDSKVMHGEAAPKACDEQLSDSSYFPPTTG